MTAEFERKLHDIIHPFDFISLSVLDKPIESTVHFDNEKIAQKWSFYVDRFEVLKWAMQNPDFDFRAVCEIRDYDNETIFRCLKWEYECWKWFFDTHTKPQNP